jgi:hypothetical protein
VPPPRTAGELCAPPSPAEPWAACQRQAVRDVAGKSRPTFNHSAALSICVLVTLVCAPAPDTVPRLTLFLTPRRIRTSLSWTPLSRTMSRTKALSASRYRRMSLPWMAV